MPSLLCNFTTDSLRPRASTVRSPHLCSHQTHRALLQEALNLFTPCRAARLIAGQSKGLPGQGWETAGSRAVALDWGGGGGRGEATPLQAGAPHLGGGKGMQASWRRGAGPRRRSEVATQRCPRSRLAAVTRTVESPRAQCALVSGSPAPGG